MRHRLANISKWFSALLLWFPSISNSSNCAPSNHQIEAARKLIQPVTIIETDDREEKSRQGQTLEAAQGRLWCLPPTFRLPKGQKITKAFLKKNAAVANATVAFDDDLVLVPTHAFRTYNGKTANKISSCYFEHIKSNELIQFADLEIPEQRIALQDKASSSHRDYALARLTRKVENGSAIPKEDILVDLHINRNEDLTVISNYNEGKKFSDPEVLTFASCKRYGRYSFPDKSPSNAIATNCDTKDGSSGAQVYVRRDGRAKLIGLASGDAGHGADGEPLDLREHATIISQFDNSIFDAYDAIRARSGRRSLDGK